MNTQRLYEILNETTVQLRKGQAVERRTENNIEVVEVFAMPHESAAKPEVIKVDMEFLVVGVDKQAAEKHKDELIAILKTYPNPERLAAGPSYIEVGGVIGDQGAAFQLFAIGKVLGLWDVLPPATFGMTGKEGRDAAGVGYIMITGFHPAMTESAK